MIHSLEHLRAPQWPVEERPAGRPGHRPRDCDGFRCGFTMVEVVISVVIVGLLLAASLQAVAVSNLTQYRISERARANQLARALLAEITQLAYVDSGNTPLFGPESGETRATFDDVDDYNGFGESLPAAKDGTKLKLPRANTWGRSVSVVWVDPQTLAPALPQAETGAKLITVTVQHNGFKVLSISAIRTAAP